MRKTDVFTRRGDRFNRMRRRDLAHVGAVEYVWEPGVNRSELRNAGARLLRAPGWKPVSRSQAELARGQAWG